MSDDITIDVGMNNAAYLTGADQVYGANSKLQASMLGVSSGSMTVQKALSLITPGRATLVGFTALAAAAANTEDNLSGLRATSAVTGISTEKLSKSMRQLARDMPIGNDGSRQLIQQFTQMGVSSAGSEGRISKLATSVARLAGATGEDAGGLAQGMTQFARATGNINLDPKRYSDLSDSLVRVSKTVGASATDVLAFSKNIAPLAQQAGIGSTGIIGISASFAKLGEDGVGASTAISKMMSDMARSVHEGTPEVKNYAEIVGTTAENFKKMYVADPAGTLNKVTEAIAKAGPGGARILETLGLEGTRSQRAIGALVSSGGLKPAIAEAQAGYGSGDAKKASDEAFNGLNSSLTELNSASQQLADAFGAPLLAPLKIFVDLLKVPTKFLADTLGTKTSQNIMGGVGIGAAAFLGAKSLTGLLSAFGLVRQMGTSGIVNSGLAGLASGRGLVRGLGENGGLSAEQRTAGVRIPWLSRVSERTMRAEEEGRLRTGWGAKQKGFVYDSMQQTGMANRGWYAERDANRAEQAKQARNERIAKVGTGQVMKEERAAAEEQTRRAGMSSFARGRENVRLYGGTALDTWNRDMNRIRKNSYVNYEDRVSGTGASPFARAAGTEAKAAYQSRDGNIFQNMRAGGKAFDESLRASGQHVSMFNSNVKSLSGVVRTYTGVANQMVKTTAGIASMPFRGGGGGGGFVSGVGRAASAGAGLGRGLMGAMGGPAGLAIMGGISGYMYGKKVEGQNAQAFSDLSQSDAYSQLNKYREANGQAGVPQLLMGSVDPSAEERAKAGTVVTAEEAVKVTPEQLALARRDGGKPLHTNKGTTAQIIAQINNMSDPKGRTVQDIVNIRSDQLKQVGATVDSVQAIMTGVGTKTFDSTGGRVGSGSNVASITAATAAATEGNSAGGMIQNYPGGNPISQGFTGFMSSLRVPGWEVGGSHRADFRSAAAIKDTAAIGAGIKTTNDEQGKLYKGNLASQNRIDAEDAAYAQAIKNKDPAQMAALAENFKLQNMGADYQKGENKVISPEDIAKYGTFNKAAAALDPKVYGAKGGIYQQTVDEQNKAGGRIKAVVQTGSIADVLRAPSNRGMNDFAANLYDQGNTSKAAKALQKSVGLPGNVGLSNAAGAAFISAGKAGEGNIINGKKTAMSLDELETAAYSLKMSLTGTAATAATASAALQQIGLERSRTNISTSSTMQQEIKDASTRKRIEVFNNQSDKTPEDNTNNVADQQSLIDSDQIKANKLRSYLEAHRSYEKQVARSTYQADQAAKYQAQDYQTSVDRTNAAARLNETNQAFDFNQSLARNEHDFQVTKANQLRDYNISVANTELAYNRTRSRTLRDFNISQARQIEDAAKTMFDPYNRIQTKATWDVQNLMVNMRQQNEAMEKQKAQLDELRKAGVSKQVIDQLQLGKTENAQQVNNLALDLKNNPNAVNDLNKVGVQRGKDAGALFNDPANTENERAKQDLQKGLGDMATDVATSLKQSQVAFNNAQADQNKAYALSLAHSLSDYAKNLQRTRDANALNLSYMAADNAKAQGRARKALNDNLGFMETDIKDADSSILGTLSQLHDAAVKTMAGEFGSYKGIMSRDLSDLIGTMNKKAPEFKSALGQYGVSVADITVGPNGAATAAGGAKYPLVGTGGGTSVIPGIRRAAGGPINGFSPHSRADNIDAKVTAGEFIQPVDAVQHYGAGVMESIRTKKIPKQALTDYSEPAGYSAGGMVWPSMWGWAHKKFPDVQMTSNFRPGGASYHARGSAIDLAPPTADIFNGIKSMFGTAIKELIYSPMKDQQIKDGHAVKDSFYAAVRDAHFNHVHWAMEPGKDMSTGMPIAGGSGEASGGGGISAAQVSKLLGFDQKRGGLYGKMRDKIEAAVMAKFAQAGDTSGDTGAHGSGPAANQKIAAGLLKRYGFDQGQMVSLIKLWNGESGWNEKADNPSSDAYGIPQSLPGTKMASAGQDWRTNPATQINWGLNYIKSRYGSPDKALAQWNARSPHWYDQGGVMSPGRGQYVNATGKPEAVLNHAQWDAVTKLSNRAGELISKEESKAMGASNGVHMTVHHNEVITYDSRNDFSDAKITVMTQDPDDMARQLEKKVVKGRVTQTRGVRRN